MRAVFSTQFVSEPKDFNTPKRLWPENNWRIGRTGCGLSRLHLADMRGSVIGMLILLPFTPV
jgi:hypothetical protein